MVWNEKLENSREIAKSIIEGLYLLLSQ